MRDALLICAIVVGVGLLVAVLTTLDLAWDDRATVLRRIGWIIVGFAGIPALLVGTVYLIGIPIALAAFGFGFLIRGLPERPRVTAALAAGMLLYGAVTVAVNDPDDVDGRVVGCVLAVSAAAAVASLLKLGALIGKARVAA